MGSTIVTGGATGIGFACARALAQSGRNVCIADLDDAKGEQAARGLSDAGMSATFVHADMADVRSITALVQTAEDWRGPVEVLVNNAAVTRVISILDVTVDDWDRIMDINARGYFFALQETARRMRETGGGAIVNVASIAGKGFRETTNIAYACSKGAVITMTRIAAAALGPDGIRVNAVVPGMTKTEMWSDWVEGRAGVLGISEAELREELDRKVPIGKLNEPSDVANAVAFLASDAARTITGQSLNVDGGTMWD